MTNTSPLKILFICRHNSVRSQIAEILANKIGGSKVLAISAGIDPQPVPEYIHQWASQFDTQGGTLNQKSVSSLEDEAHDLIITLCDKTHQSLPELPQDREHIRWDFHHPDDEPAVKHLEIELSERLRLMFLAKGII